MALEGTGKNTTFFEKQRENHNASSKGGHKKFKVTINRREKREKKKKREKGKSTARDF